MPTDDLRGARFRGWCTKLNRLLAGGFAATAILLWHALPAGASWLSDITGVVLEPRYSAVNAEVRKVEDLGIGDRPAQINEITKAVADAPPSVPIPPVVIVNPRDGIKRAGDKTIYRIDNRPDALEANRPRRNRKCEWCCQHIGLGIS